MDEIFELCTLFKISGMSLKNYSFIDFVFQVFGELGILSKITRICGASAGAIAGTLLAVGYSPVKLKEFLSQDLDKILLGKGNFENNY